MSFGRPPNYSTFTVTPPDRGSFPLDHEGECKSLVVQYMKCMRENKMDNGRCRYLSKQYLQCRMDRGLMEKDEMSNLGFHDDDSSPSTVNSTTAPAPAASSPSSSKARMV